MHKIKIQFILLNCANCCLLVILYNINASNYYSSIDIRELRKSEMLLDKNVIYQYVKHLFLNKTFVTKTKILGNGQRPISLLMRPFKYSKKVGRFGVF